ncbi:hemin uptake protein HemP [Enterovirga rhinocerotis]|uniref:Hemin uptake protein HemP n=1 Tax=Enterovirga rhinocerotis TaxID=1339210 RepID=A0A4R7BYH7_9HYPH|nr:hemin uptake protein HemP [Enterovirga rhinocerotis]TDR89267.1 hemin uptake protein HemP [Enterovirga rhinocerotis]
MAEDDPERRNDAPPSAPSSQQLPSFDTSVLFGTRREVILVHKGEQYRLRQTQSGKLILTK